MSGIEVWKSFSNANDDGYGRGQPKTTERDDETRGKSNTRMMRLLYIRSDEHTIALLVLLLSSRSATAKFFAQVVSSKPLSSRQSIPLEKSAQHVVLQKSV